ncbi:MAG: hypothetical protein WCL61_02350 [bacterium]
MPNIKKAPSTQKHLEIAEIRDDMVIMKDGTMRAVVLASSINFALKSEDEQNAIVSAYVSFLNSIDWPLQIVIQSRKLDLDNYFATLIKAEREQTNELLKVQIASYRTYIKELVEMGDIMTKKFFIVVSYNPKSSRKRSFWSRASDVFSPVQFMGLSDKQFRQRKSEIESRINKVVSGISGMGVRCTLVDTQGLIELYYTVYNPGRSKIQKMTDIDKLRFDDSQQF